MARLLPGDTGPGAAAPWPGLNVRLSVSINGRLPSPAKYTEYREERRQLIHFLVILLEQSQLLGDTPLSAPECGNEPGEKRDKESLYPGEREASICFLLHNTLIVLELIFSRDKKYILNLVSNYTSDVLWSIDHHCWLCGVVLHVNISCWKRLKYLCDMWSSATCGDWRAERVAAGWMQ